MYGFHSEPPSWFSGIAPHRCSLRPGFDSKRESTFYGEGYIGRNHAHPRNHGAVSDETKIPRLPKAIVGSKSIRTLPSLLWRSEAKGNTRNRLYDPGVPPR